MIDKQTFFKDFVLDSSHKLNAVNQLIYSWHQDDAEWIKQFPNNIREEYVDGLKVAIPFWLYLFNAEAEGFRDRRHNQTFHKLLKKSIINNEPLSFFGILCPSYKKGIGAVGFADQPGNTTHRAFNNLKRMGEVAKQLGLKHDMQMFYSDISIENYQHFSDQEWKALERNIELDREIAASHEIKYMTLTGFDSLLDKEVGVEGRIGDVSKLPIDLKALERAMWRDRQFYPSMFGWTVEQAEQRTVCHGHSYYWQGEAIRRNLTNPVMVYSAYDYEKGALYNGPDGSHPPCIIYPKKLLDNPPTATLPEFDSIMILGHHHQLNSVTPKFDRGEAFLGVKRG